MGRHRTGYILACFLSWALSASAQDLARSIEPGVPAADSVRRQNSAGILFDRNLNTYTWVGRASIDTVSGITRVSLAEQYVANIVQVDAPGGRRKLESDQQNISLVIAHPVSELLTPTAQWSSLVYTDNKGIGLGNASMHSVLAGIEYAPLPSISLTPLVGYRWDYQNDIRDRGPAYTLMARANNIDLDGYRMEGNAQYHEDRLDPRRIETHQARLSIQKAFTALTRDSLDAGYFRNRREFYALADSTIESRLENVFGVTNMLDYGFDRNLSATVFLTVAGRILDKSVRPFGGTGTQAPYATRIDEFRLDTYLQARYVTDDGRSGGLVRVSYSERDEAHTFEPPAGALARTYLDRDQQERSKDNLTRRTALSGTAEIGISRSDRLLFSGSASILRYDTPSELNHDDRDEVLMALTIGTSHRISKYLDIGVSLDGTISHLVYLLADRSANNNYNRILRLAPRTTVRPIEAVVSMNAFEVLANYTVYDFEQQLATARSFAYRQFGWIDSTSIQVTRRIGLDFFTYLKFYERGQLKWSEFKERTENSFVERTNAIQLRYSPNPLTMLAAGVRYFSQTRYAYEGSAKRVETFLRSIGPTCAILWQAGPHSQVGLRGWYELRRQPDGSQQGIASMTMTILLNF